MQLRNYLDVRLYAIDIEAALCEVRGNQIDLLSAAWGGIRASGAHATIVGNIVGAIAQEGQVMVPAGIYCVADAKNGRAADHTAVRNNQLLGPQSGIVISRIGGAAVSGNHLDGGGGGWYGVRVDDCTGAQVEDNDLRELFFAVHLSEGERNRVTGNRIDQAGTGITATQETDLEVSGNTLQSCLLLGMALFVRGNTALLGNRVRNCGYASALSIGIGVYAEEVWTPTGAHLRIEDCEVVDTGISADGNQITTVSAIGIGGWIPACQISGNRVGYTPACQARTAQRTPRIAADRAAGTAFHWRSGRDRLHVRQRAGGRQSLPWVRAAASWWNSGAFSTPTTSTSVSRR